MDYKAKIQGNAKSFIHKIASMQDALDNAKYSFDTYLSESLELMYNELAKRNGYQTSLSAEEKEIIDYVESGRLKQDLESMPKVLADQLKERTEQIYTKAKKNMPLDELVVCGFLHEQEISEQDKKMFTLTIPVRFANRDKIGTLEEALYGHHLNVDFQSEKEHYRYIQFGLVVPRIQEYDAVENLISVLEQNLPAALINANVRYGVLGLCATFDQLLHAQGRISQKLSEEETKMQQPYTTEEAVKLWREHELVQGHDIPIKIFQGKIRNYMVAKKKYFDATRDKEGNAEINPGSFLAFINSITFKKSGSRWLPKRIKNIDDITIKVPEQGFYTGREVTNLMLERLKADNIHIPYANAYQIIARAGRREDLQVQPLIKRTEDGSLLYEKNSADEFLKQYFIKPGKGKEKKYYLAKRPEQWNGITDIIGKKVSMGQAMNILDVSDWYIRDRIRKGEITGQVGHGGYVTGQSLKEFIRTHEKLGGPKKTFWRKKK